jgi:hypothetical protein
MKPYISPPWYEQARLLDLDYTAEQAIQRGLLSKEEAIQRGLLPKDDATTENPVNQETQAEVPSPAATKASKIAQAMAILSEHPELSVKEIAKLVPCSANYLSQNQDFREARRAVKSIGRSLRPHGRKSRDGSLEAED